MTGQDARKLAAEALGTGFLLAAVVGSGIMADQRSDDAAIELLANTIPTGAILFVLITALGPVSGAHFNPAVTLVFWRRGELNGRLAGGYVVAQCVGGLLGVLFAHLMFNEAPFQISTTVRTGPDQWFAEGVATFGLIFTILATLRARPDAVPLAVGLYITSAYWFTASTSFANPAVTLARSFSDTFAGINPFDAPAFIATQLAAAVAAAWFCRWLLDERPTPQAARSQAAE